jgi:uncharacterized membrane protein
MKLELPTLRRAFITGLVVLSPLVVTGWVFVSLFRFVDGRMRPFLAQMPFLRDSLPDQGLTGIGFLAAIILVVLVGLLANNLLGRAVFGTLDRVIHRIPWIKGVYSATKEISGVVFAEKSTAFRKVVLFEYPRRGLYSLGFVTQELSLESGDRLLHVFLPTTPNPTSGYFLMVPSKDAIQLPISIEDGLKLVVSGGAVLSVANRHQLDAVVTRFNR